MGRGESSDDAGCDGCANFAAIGRTKQRCARFARRKSEDVYLFHLAAVPFFCHGTKRDGTVEEEVLFDILLVMSSNDAATTQIELSQIADSQCSHVLRENPFRVDRLATE